MGLFLSTTWGFRRGRLRAHPVDDKASNKEWQWSEKLSVPCFTNIFSGTTTGRWFKSGPRNQKKEPILIQDWFFFQRNKSFGFVKCPMSVKYCFAMWNTPYGVWIYFISLDAKHQISQFLKEIISHQRSWYFTFYSLWTFLEIKCTVF